MFDSGEPFGKRAFLAAGFGNWFKDDAAEKLVAETAKTAGENSDAPEKAVEQRA